MSKVAAYLQEHILGEVVAQPAVLDTYSRDASILKLKPEMVVYPRVTNDIRKVARFAWQLAEKGHILPITMRGGGTDQTGAAIGRGIIVATPVHMDQLLEFDLRQKLVRLQPGMNAKALSDALMIYGLDVPTLPRSAAWSTVGGAVANNTINARTNRTGTMRRWVHELEVVLANGDVLQTKRLSRRELSKKKGLQTFEGEIYRSVSNLLDDNRELIETGMTENDIRSGAGYGAIAEVRRKDGSFDLTPLFVGSQGTLGLISEMILKTDYIPSKRSVMTLAFPTMQMAFDALDAMTKFQPDVLEYYDGGLFEAAEKQGGKYAVYQTADHRALVVAVFEGFNDHKVAKRFKRACRYFAQTDAHIITSRDVNGDELLSVRGVVNYTLFPPEKGVSAPPLCDGLYVPAAQRDEFVEKLADIAKKHHVEMPLYGDMLENVWYARPHLQLSKVSEKQKAIKLVEEVGAMVAELGGDSVAEAGEGRLRARAARHQVDDELRDLYAAVKDIFDPHGILNPGVKHVPQLRELAAMLQADYDSDINASYGVWY